MSLPPHMGDAPVQRKGNGGDRDQESAALSSDGSGKAMPADVQAKMERSLGADFSAVRIHEGPQATAMGALAYTQGTNIHFAPGQYQPGSQRGQELLGHELTHVVQQSQGRVNTTTQAKRVGVNDDAGLEREADEMGARVAREEREGPSMLAPAPLEAHNAAAGPVQMRARRADPELAPEPAPDKDSGHAAAAESGSANSFDGLKALVSNIAGNVKIGTFADATFKVAIPVPEVPGLSIKVSASGSFAVDKKGEQKLKMNLGVGVQYQLGSLFNVNGDFNEAITLKGADLGAALVDCVKQSAYWALEKTGIHARFAELVRLATEGPDFWDYAKLLIPIYNNYQAAKLVISTFGVDKIEAAHAAFIRFFRNDANVGFEASIGVGVGAGVKTGDKGGSGRLEARAGLEDVGGKQTKGFTELAGEVGGNLGNSSVKVRYARRFREGGQQLNVIEIQSALSMPKKAFNSDGSEGLMRKTSFLWSIISVARNLYNAKEGGSAGDVMGLVSSVLGLGSQVFGNTKNFDSLWGLDVKVTEADGHWTVDDARVKLMTQFGTGTGVSVGGIEANVKVGTFFDVSGVLNQGLAALAGK